METPQAGTAVADRPTSGPDDPIIVFDHVSLAFDDTVVLRDVSFELRRGHTKIILGASGAGKSISLKLILGLLKADAGKVWVNGQLVNDYTEEQMMKVRADIGMVFQEGALFDSLTVGENVGFKLYEETDQPLDVIRNGSKRCSASFDCRSSSTGSLPSCRADSGAASRSPAP